MDFKRNTYFVLNVPNPSGWSFSSYSDYETREMTGAKKGTDRHGNQIWERFQWKPSQRVLQIPNGRKEQILALKNSPFCEGSPHKPSKPTFKILDYQQEAEIVLDEAIQKSSAEHQALVILKGKKLKNISALYGCFDYENEIMMRSTLVKAAGYNPGGFLEACSDDLLEYKSLIKECVQKGIIKVNGTIHTWEVKGKTPLTLGPTHDSAVAKMMTDLVLKDALTKSLEQKDKSNPVKKV